MTTERKFPTVWEVYHPGEPLPSPKEARERMERAAAAWSKRFAEDPALIEAFRRDCGCGPSASDE